MFLNLEHLHAHLHAQTDLESDQGLPCLLFWLAFCEFQS